ncbi:NepR family anti-sigma factor [Hoeflea sp. CAU 1731]
MSINEESRKKFPGKEQISGYDVTYRFETGVFAGYAAQERRRLMSKNRPSGDARSRGSEEIDPNSEIARQLRTIYREVETETIPDRFLDLLEKLDAAEASQKDGNRK